MLSDLNTEMLESDTNFSFSQAELSKWTKGYCLELSLTKMIVGN